MAMARLFAMACTLVASCSFCSMVPARPLPDCKSFSILFKTSVEDSMFFTAAVMSALLVASTPSAASARRINSCEKKTTLLTARLTCEPLVAMSALMSFTVPIACSENVRILFTVAEKLVSVCSFSTTRRKSVTEASSFLAVSSMRWMNPEAERATSCKLNGSWQSTSAPFVSTGGEFVVGMMETYWSPRKPDCSMTNRASW